MASFEETEIFPSSLRLHQRQQPTQLDPDEPPPFSPPPPPPPVVGPVPEPALVEGIRNVVLEEAGDEASEENDGNLDDRGENSHYPLGIYAPNCHFYLRNGWCKFGMNCRFSHPVKRTGTGESQVFQRLVCVRGLYVSFVRVCVCCAFLGIYGGLMYKPVDLWT